MQLTFDILVVVTELPQVDSEEMVFVVETVESSLSSSSAVTWEAKRRKD